MQHYQERLFPSLLGRERAVLEEREIYRLWLTVANFSLRFFSYMDVNQPMKTIIAPTFVDNEPYGFTIDYTDVELR